MKLLHVFEFIQLRKSYNWLNNELHKIVFSEKKIGNDLSTHLTKRLLLPLHLTRPNLLFNFLVLLWKCIVGNKTIMYFHLSFIVNSLIQ